VVDGTMALTWLCAGVATGSLLTYRLVSGLFGHQKEQDLQNFKVENEALGRTNMIYRERIEQLENALFSNEKFNEMVREIDFLRSSNFKLRSRLKDLECLVEAEKKRTSREQVERLEKTVKKLRHKIEKKAFSQEDFRPIEVLPTRTQVAATIEPVLVESVENGNKNGGEHIEDKKWATIQKAKKIP